jgi:hypothetical protein
MLCNKRSFQLMVVLFLCTAGPVQASAGRSKDLVWSQSDGLRHEIYYSSLAQGQETWEAPQKLTDNNANNLHPVLDRAPDGSRWVFWSAIRPDGISLEYTVGKEGAWANPMKMPLDHDSAISPSVRVDPQGRVWLVWAGNDGGQDEIYFSRWQEGVWEEAQILNSPNEVPDIKPELTWDAQGRPTVTWYGFREEGYTLLRSTYVDGVWSPEQELLLEEEAQDAEEILWEHQMELPSFVAPESQYLLKVF